MVGSRDSWGTDGGVVSGQGAGNTSGVLVGWVWVSTTERVQPSSPLSTHETPTRQLKIQGSRSRTVHRVPVRHRPDTGPGTENTSRVAGFSLIGLDGGTDGDGETLRRRPLTGGRTGVSPETCRTPGTPPSLPCPS